MTIKLVISLPKIPCIHCMYMVLANPRHGKYCFSHLCSLSFFRYTGLRHTYLRYTYIRNLDTLCKDSAISSTMKPLPY
jgi:hypothetical protein